MGLILGFFSIPLPLVFNVSNDRLAALVDVYVLDSHQADAHEAPDGRRAQRSDEAMQSRIQGLQEGPWCTNVGCAMVL